MDQLKADSSSSEDLDDLCIDHELVDLDEIAVAPRKPHFLDYDAVPPPGFEDTIETPLKLTPSIAIAASSAIGAAGGVEFPGENVVDKKYERDGEISDYELVASGITKKDVKLQRNSSQDSDKGSVNGTRKKKHFLDENPIPPDYMSEREHRSLDRNFERQGEYGSLRYERKHSLDREARARKVKESNYTLSRFIESEIVPACRGTWPVDKPSECNLGYSSMPPENMSVLGPKVECVYSLLSMLGSHDSVEMSKKFLELSRSNETCATLRRSGCIPLLVQMMHSDSDDGVRKRAAMALHNVVHCHPDDKAGRREAKVLRLIEQIMDYCSFLKTLLMSGGEAIADDTDRHPLPAISSLMKVSFDEEHRHAMCQLGALQAIAGLVHLDHAVHGPKPEDQCCNSLRRYALMALTNLTFGDGNNKSNLCANKDFMEALVAQLDYAPDDLLQVTASVLRNLSWRADNNMKTVLNEIGTVTALAKAAMKNKNENTLKAILSALWNLSAHCSTNKAEFCAVDGALAFLVDMLTYEGPSKTLKIIENAGGILRNVSSHIAVREDYRRILRQRNCLGILLQQLKSESLTVVSNACGTLWNLSARFPEDQKYLWDNGAVPMLRSLIHSKHKMISEGSSAALKNLLNFRPGVLNQNNLDPITKSMGLPTLPTLNARKQKAFEQELNQNLAETCENLDATTPPKENKNFTPVSEFTKPASQTRLTRSAMVSKSDSRDSITSAKSDSIYEKLRRGQTAPPAPNLRSSEAKSSTGFGVRNNFVESGFDVEPETEQPIDYSAKYNNEAAAANVPVQDAVRHSKGRKNESRNMSAYQETDLDQLTDFSLRYAENQADSDSDEKPAANPGGNEIILILEDSVKCYQTEGTPYFISNAASVSDLRNHTKPDGEPSAATVKRVPQKHDQPPPNPYGSGTYTPEKPINYCEEGTPGYFSRYDSLSSLDESPPNCANAAKANSKPKLNAIASNDRVAIELTTAVVAVPVAIVDVKTDLQRVGVEKKRAPALPLTIAPSAPPPPPVGGPSTSTAPKPIPSANSAQETPLMFSRRSSMDSLASTEPIIPDDKSSVVSDFSRLASGIISPSELPDSPTQSMPQSPCRNSSVAAPQFVSAPVGPRPTGAQRLRSVFQDELNTFRVEDTPAQFSCATSLSNLTIDDEPKAAGVSVSPKPIGGRGKSANGTKDISPLSEEEEDAVNPNDDILLATCINIGMGASTSKLTDDKPKAPGISVQAVPGKEVFPSNDAITQYFTEDTPALLSKVGSNSNLSALSMYTNKCEISNLSDESSNASDGGNELLEQCIRDGMKKTASSTKPKISMNPNEPSGFKSDLPMTAQKLPVKDPIAMLKRGDLPSYLPPQRDELRNFNLEDSPCNFSVVSGLSDLTVGSGKVGPIKSKDDTLREFNATVVQQPLPSGNNKSSKEKEKEKPIAHDDSTSSISIESEDDANLLNQVIAAGCNKSKVTRPLTSVSIPIQINESSRRARSSQSLPHQEPNDSISSIDSSDSNDNQARSLLEQCIRTGMNKEKKAEQRSSQSQITSPRRSQLPLLNFSSSSIRTPLKNDRERQRNRDRKDEQLLNDCINTGISKNIRIDSQIRPPTHHVRQVLAPTEFNQRFITGGATISTQIDIIPKNGGTTSVAVLQQQQQQTNIKSQGVSSTAPGVEMRELPDGIEHESRSQQLRLDQRSSPQLNRIGSDFDTVGHRMEESELTTVAAMARQQHEQHHQLQHHQHQELVLDHHQQQQQQQAQHYHLHQQLEASYGSLNLSLELNGPLDQSNEYPAQKTNQHDYDEDSFNESSFEMEISNEFLIERGDVEDESVPHSIKPDKHKDPDLMLKSVERLTQELVSTAEYLRTTASINLDDGKSGSNSNSNNTWNEDTCPNDVSFPSLSLTAPMIASLNDDEATISEVIQPREVNRPPEFNEKTPTNELYTFTIDENINNYPSLDDQSRFYGTNSQPNSLETETDTLINDETDGSSASNDKKNTSSSNGINFRVGGEVQQFAGKNNFLSSGPMSFNINSTMTNSTIIAMEADKLANQLMMQNMGESTTSLNLDSIRPPSGMETLSMSGCYDVPQSPQLSRLRKRSLPAGLMAKRALGGCQPSAGISGSVESVNSSCNLDNIKPPSLMDELLDSMISVASITSEIVDNSLGTPSNYETAFSDVDENTTTLQSCMDGFLPLDYDSNDTPIPSDFSSAESTPRKTRNCNYYVLGGVKRALTPKQKRKIIKDRFRTYTIAADFVLKENYVENGEAEQATEGEYYEEEDEEIIKVEIEHSPNDRPNQCQTEQQTGEMMTVNRHVRNNEIQSPQKRRSLDPDRFRTRTISYRTEQDNGNAIKTLQWDNEQDSFTSTEDNTDEMSSIRAMTKQFKYINEPDPYPDPDDNCSDLTYPNMKPLQPRSRAAMEHHETRTATESDYNSMDYDQNSETESCDLNMARNDDEETSPRKQLEKARIVKPSETAGSNSPKSPNTPIEKVIRGRRKPVYVSPYRKPAISNARTTSPKSQGPNNTFRANLATKIASPEAKKASGPRQIPKNQTIVAKTHVIINKQNLSNKLNIARNTTTQSGGFINGALKRNIVVKNFINKKLSGIAKGSENGAEAVGEENSQPTRLDRQGTFVKEEPLNAQVPVVTSPPQSPAKTSKLPTKKLPNAPKSPAKPALATRLRNSLHKTATTAESSGKVFPKATNLTTARHQQKSATALDTAAAGSRRSSIGVRKSPSVPTVPQRSNSNASIKFTSPFSVLRTNLPSTTPPSRSNSNLTAPRLNITSRIAGIWKKTDDSSKTPPRPPAKSAGKVTSTPGQLKLIRSSTFDSSPPLDDDKQSSAFSQAKMGAAVTTTGLSTRLRQPKASASSSVLSKQKDDVAKRNKPAVVMNGGGAATSKRGSVVGV